MTVASKVLHITEALGGGVAHSVSQLALIQAANGFEVIVAHSIRVDTPSEEKLEALFPPPIRRVTLPIVTPVTVPTAGFENYVLQQLPMGQTTGCAAGSGEVKTHSMWGLWPGG